MNYHITNESKNAKTGPIPVTTSSRATCWQGCAFYEKGCYAKGGPLGVHWQAVTKGERGGSMDDLCRAIANLPTGTLWRHNQAGDLPGKGARIASKQLAKLVAANASAQAKGFTYTHKPMTEANQKAVKHANQHGFTVNLSANSLVHADQLADLNIGPVASVVPHIGKARGPYEGPKQGTTGKGRKWAVCPAILDHDGKRGITCENCQLCSKADRSVIVAFPAHGSAYKSASIASIDDETKRRRALVKQAVVAARANK